MTSGETPPSALRAVFDCGIFLQATLRRDGPAGVCLDRVEEGSVELIASDPVLVEVREVLGRPELKARRQGRLTDAIVEALMAWIDEHSTRIAEVPPVFSYPRDPDDEPYLDLAITSGAVYLVSRDNDLPGLQVPDSEDGNRLRALAPDLTILDPVAFLRLFSSDDEST